MASKKELPQKFECISEAFEFVKSLTNQKIVVLKSGNDIYVEGPGTMIRSWEQVLYTGYVSDCILTFGHEGDIR